MTEANRGKNARAEVALGEEALQEAELLLRGGLHHGAVSRAYYAAFHFARALLLTEGLEPKTHRGVITLLGERLAASGRVTPETAAILARLQTARSGADYDAARLVSADEAGQEVAAARRFVAEAAALLRSGGWIG